jgi:hypothetical protein
MVAVRIGEASIGGPPGRIHRVTNGAASLSGAVEGKRPGKEKAEPINGVSVAVYGATSEVPIDKTGTIEGGKYAVELESGVYEVRFDPGSSGPFEPTTVGKWK